MSTIVQKNERREEMLLSALKTKKHLGTMEAAELLDISMSTARRLFTRLEKKGLILRTYGGVQSSPDVETDYYFEDVEQRRPDEKMRIGLYACELVESGDIIFLDSGTTLQRMAFALSRRIKEGAAKDVQIYTNSLENLKILQPACDVHLIGGLFRAKRKDFCGHLSEMVLQTIAFKKCFLGADGIRIHPTEGIMATDVFTARLNEIAAGRSDRIYVLADSTKFMRRSFIRYAPLEKADLFITDTDLEDGHAGLFAAAGANIRKV